MVSFVLFPSPQWARALYTIERDDSRIVPVPKALLPHRYCQEEIRAGLWLSFCLSLCTWFSWGSWHRFPAHCVSASACPSLSTHPVAWCLIPVVLSAQITPPFSTLTAGRVCSAEASRCLFTAFLLPKLTAFPSSALTFFHFCVLLQTICWAWFFSFWIHGSYL